MDMKNSTLHRTERWYDRQPSQVNIFHRYLHTFCILNVLRSVSHRYEHGICIMEHSCAY